MVIVCPMQILTGLSLNAKLNKDYARADEVREELKEQGIVLEDSREGTRWRRS